MPRAPNYNKPLPDCAGPKLSPFKDREANIEFHRLLSDGDSKSSGGHSHVFEVGIKSITYALKVVRVIPPQRQAPLVTLRDQFKFYDQSEDVELLLKEERKRFSPSLIQAHKDPFYNECRAYGRIAEAGLNGKIAAYCYGFLTIPAAMEDYFKQEFHVATWDRPAEDYEKPAALRRPLRAIVKELVTDEAEFTAKDIKKMLGHLKRLARLGIYPRDVRARNYRAGLLVDFSTAMTEPHYRFEILSEASLADLKSEDLLLFDSMIQEAKIDTWVRATPNHDYMKRLRRPPEKPVTFIW